MPTSADGILTAEFDPTRALVMLTVDGGMWPSPVASITMSRATVGAASEPVRGLDERTNVAGGWWLGSDQEMPLDAEVTYTATGYSAAGAVVRSANVTVSTAGRSTWTPVRRNLAAQPFATASSGPMQAASAASWGGTPPTASSIADPTAPSGHGFARRLTAVVAKPAGALDLIYALPSNRVPITVGVPITLSVWVRASAQIEARPQAQFLTTGGAGAGSVNAAAVQIQPDTWTRLSVTATATSPDAASVRFDIDSGATAAWAAGFTLDHDALLIDEGVALGDYFDGDTPSTGGVLPPVGSVRNAWDGARNASASTQSVVTSVERPAWGLWLKLAGRPDWAVRCDWVGISDRTTATQGGVYQVHGGDAVGQSSGAQAERFTATIATRTPAQAAAVRRLLAQPGRTLLLQTGQPEEIPSGWYFVESHSETNPTGLRSDHQPLRQFALQVVRVAAPAGGGGAFAGATYRSVQARHATYADIAAAGTYADIARGA